MMYLTSIHRLSSPFLRPCQEIKNYLSIISSISNWHNTQRWFPCRSQGSRFVKQIRCSEARDSLWSKSTYKIQDNLNLKKKIGRVQHIFLPNWCSASRWQVQHARKGVQLFKTSKTKILQWIQLVSPQVNLLWTAIFKFAWGRSGMKQHGTGTFIKHARFNLGSVTSVPGLCTE